jgi:hypothetical protein
MLHGVIYKQGVKMLSGQRDASIETGTDAGICGQIEYCNY